MDGAKYADALQVLADSGIQRVALKSMKRQITQPARTVDLREQFISAAIIGDLGTLPPQEAQERIDRAKAMGYSRCFWEINQVEAGWTERYDQELKLLPAPPIAVLNVGASDTNFIRFFKWFDRYAERLHSVVINADKLDNYDFKQADQQREANRTLNALYGLIKARQPTAFVWVRVVWADDQSDVNWLKALTFQPDGLLVWNLPAFQSPFAAAQRRYRAQAAENTPFLAGEFYGLWSLVNSTNTPAEAGRAIGPRLGAFSQDLQRTGYRGLAPNWRLFKSIAAAQTSAPPPLQASVSAKDAAARSRRLAWAREDTVKAYGKVGKTDPRWDAAANLALELYAQIRSEQVEASELANSQLGAYLETAVGAGCNDALIGYLHTRYAQRAGDSTPEYVQASMAAAEAVESSGYSEVRKFLACINTANAIRVRVPDLSNAPPDLKRFTELAQRHLVSVLEKEAVPDGEVRVLCEQWMRAKKLRANQFAAYEAIEKPVFEHWSQSAWAWLLKGATYIEYAWEARGSGWAKTVSDEGWRLFYQRLAIAEQALAQSWNLDPSTKEVAEQMITLETGQGKGRERMEWWFRKAMQMDTNDHMACLKKLYYLEPKWHGSPEEMLAFGRECVASKEWGGQVPLVLVWAHETLQGYAEREGQTNYWTQPDVWPDLKSSFEKFLQVNPNVPEWRHRYVWYAYQCEQWEDCDKQMSLLSNINHNYFGGAAEYEHMVARVKQELAQRAGLSSSKTARQRP